MNKTAFVVALGAAIASIALLMLYKQRFEHEAVGGEPIRILIVVSDIELGARIERESLGVRAVPAAYVDGRHIRASDAQTIVGVRVGNRLRANEVILWTDLATTTGHSRNLASMVRIGMRAVSIPATAQSSFSGLLRPGDRVDALLTTEHPKHGRTTVPLAQNMLVLAVGADTGGVQNETEAQRSVPRNLSVTLAATVEQSAQLTLAQDYGEVSLSLRNPDDVRIVDNLPTTNASTIVRAPVTASRTAPAPLRSTSPSVIKAATQGLIGSSPSSVSKTTSAQRAARRRQRRGRRSRN